MPQIVPRKTPAILAALAAGALLAADGDAVGAPKAAATPQSISVAGIEVRSANQGTLRVVVDGATLSSESRLYCVSPDWKRRYYGFEDDKDLLPGVRTENLPDGAQRLHLPLNGQGSGFHGSLSFEARPDRRLVIKFDGKIPPGTTASVENRLLTIPAAWLTGRGVSVSPATAAGPGLIDGKERDGAMAGRAPLVAASDEVAGATFARAFSRLELDTRLGPVTITTTGTLPVSLVDYRRNKWAMGALYYWFGVLDNRLQPDGTGSYEMTIQFPPPRDPSKAMSAAINTIKPEARVLAEASQPDRVLPTPKKIEWLNGALTLPKTTVIVAEDIDERDGDAKTAAEHFADHLRDATSLTLPLVLKGQSLPPNHRTSISLAIKPLPPLENVRSERYRISFDKFDSVRVEAETTQGLRAARMTLAQLLRRGPALRRANIDDGATMPFRGIHFFTGRDAGPLQIRFLTEILAPLKITHLVWQVDYLKWDSFPAIHHKGFGMDKGQAAAVRDAARRHGISIIPLVNTFGHSEWLLDNDAMRHLADNPDNPYAYDPSNPETIPTVEKIYEEALAFFQPTDFHIGHDEITNEDFPRREENRKVGAKQLIKDSIAHWHGYLGARGIRMHLWGDMFIHSSEASDAGFADSVEDAKALRAAMPKDVVIHDWHYGPDPVEKFTSLRVLNDAGLDTVAATWYDGRNVGRFGKAAAIEAARIDAPSTAGKTLGQLQTTWAGYSFDQQSLDNHPDQYAAYVLAAESAWNGGFDNPNDLPYDYRAEFGRLWNADLLPDEPAAGWTANLAPAANFDAVPGPGAPWLGAEGAHGMDGLKSGQNRFGRWLFQIPGRPLRPQAVLFLNRFHDSPGTSRLSVPLQRPVRAIQFAVAATFPGPQGEQIAHSIVHYVDGTSETIQWKLGLSVFAIDDDRETFAAPVLWRRQSDKPDEAPRCIHGYLWTNPRPDQPIRTIETISDDKASGLLLFGLSGVNP